MFCCFVLFSTKNFILKVQFFKSINTAPYAIVFDNCYEYCDFRLIEDAYRACAQKVCEWNDTRMSGGKIFPMTACLLKPTN